MIQEHILAEMLERAAVWAKQQEEFMLRHGAALVRIPECQEIARRAGVQCPECVRLLAVSEIPLPEEPDLCQAAKDFGLITPGTEGLTIGHGIFVRQDCLSNLKLIAHELVHVAQYERLGSIQAFLQQYLSEVNEYGYPAAPMEREAIAFAEIVFPDAR